MAEGLGNHTSITSTPANAAGDDAAFRPSIDILDAARLIDQRAFAELTRLTHAAVAQLPSGTRGEIRVRIVADAEMANAHIKFSNIPGTTDVLTFDLSEGGSAKGEPLDVDILVCADEARRQAATRGHAPEYELLLYIIHGVLHCLGHDDHDDDAYARMHVLEDEILQAIGVGRVFASEASSPRRHGEHGEAQCAGSVQVAHTSPHTQGLSSVSSSGLPPRPPRLRGSSSESASNESKEHA